MKQHRSRFYLIVISFLFMWVILGVRGARLQIVSDTKLDQLQNRQFKKIVTLQPRRGDILDRRGRPLATSVTTYSLFADPKQIEDPRVVSRKLKKLLRLSSSDIYRKIKNKNRRFVWLKRRLSKRDMDRVESLKIKGISFIEEAKRVYPNGSLLTQVLGLVGSDGKGLEGIEAKYDKILRGTKQKIVVQKDARGRPLFINGNVFSETPDGANIELTIDRDIQYKLENELLKVYKEREAESATGVVLKADTSEILAMASIPSRSDSYKMTSYWHRKNRAATDVFEPGSTLKSFTVASGLKNGVLAPNTEYFAENGLLKIGRRKIGESDKKHKFGWISVNEILQKSSNIGTAKIAFELGDDRLKKTLEEFGFGEKVGTDILGESKGLFPSLPWRRHHLANISFGHGIAVTALQMANAYAAIANGGILNQPFLVRNIVQESKGKVLSKEPEPLRRVLSENHALSMRLMLTNVTSPGGTGIYARVKGFPVGGKTGTAQKVDLENGGYKKGAYVSSFAGFIPAHSPEYVIYIVVDDPKKGYYGSDVAAPVFSRVAKYLVQENGQDPILISKENLLGQEKMEPKFISNSMTSNLKNKQHDVTSLKTLIKVKEEKVGKKRISKLPPLKDLPLKLALEKLKGVPVDITVYGTGKVKRTIPIEGARLETANRIYLFMSNK